MAQQILSTNTFTTAKWIVSATASAGTHTTIASALTSASSGDTIFIRPGTYTEDLTLKAGVNLTAFGSDSSLNQAGNVIILGKATHNTAGTVTISGVELQTNSSNAIAVGSGESGSPATILNLMNCNLNCSAHTGLAFTSSGTGAQVNFNNCYGDVGTTGIALFTASSAGSINIKFCDFTNSGGSTTASTTSATAVQSYYSTFGSVFTTTLTGSYLFFECDVDSSAINTTALTTASTTASTSSIFGGYFASGSTTCVSVGANTTLFTIGTIYTTADATAVLTGAGTINYNVLGFAGAGKTINVTTQAVAGVAFGSTTTAPTAGMIGEQIRATVGVGSPTALVSTQAKTVTSIVLTAGVWDISAVCQFTTQGTATIPSCSISLVNNTNGTLGDNFITGTMVPVANVQDVGYTIPSWRLVTTGQTVYLIALMTFSVSGGAYGRISATRVG